MAQPCNQIRDLHAGQLATFTGFGALCYFNFQFLAVIEVFCGHTKATRGHLFDLSRRIVAIGFRNKMRWIFAAFTTVRFRTNAVHRNIQGFMRLRTQSPKRHAWRHKTLAD